MSIGEVFWWRETHYCICRREEYEAIDGFLSYVDRLYHFSWKQKLNSVSLIQITIVGAAIPPRSTEGQVFLETKLFFKDIGFAIMWTYCQSRRQCCSDQGNEAGGRSIAR